MSARVRITPEAEADIQEAYVWYQQARRGLGSQFLDVVQGTLSQVAGHPQAFAVVHGGIRRALLLRFPYGIFYVLDGEDVAVLGCFHARRDPTVWKVRGQRYTET
ncbi:MAG: type II toxin-antitoxin system RelE/ParE family toxin [Actinobacteria bacterium]|nr:type II toxin-antitoxin system RelE/ParE family toxin [Actinomycetota bacterium]